MFFTCELKNIFLKIEVKRKKCRDFKTLDNGLELSPPAGGPSMLRKPLV
jgi:hypothetical protein